MVKDYGCYFNKDYSLEKGNCRVQYKYLLLFISRDIENAFFELLRLMLDSNLQGVVPQVS